MYRFELKTFVAVAECRSFTAAAEKVYVSPTAVMKQMNQLEGQLGLTLFTRTNRGLSLTPAGEEFLREARAMIAHCDRLVQRLREQQEASPRILRIGDSLLNPCKPFMELWRGVSGVFPQIKIQILPFEDTARGIQDVIAQIGKTYDFIAGPMDSRDWSSRINFYPLGSYKKMVAVPLGHPLAGKEKLSPEDLHGYTMTMVSRGDSPVNDALRSFLEREHPQIRLYDAGWHYDISTYNDCAENGRLLLNMECWKDVHPGFVTIPVDWDFSLPYGVFYAKDPPPLVEEVLAAIRDFCTKPESTGHSAAAAAEYAII